MDPPAACRVNSVLGRPTQGPSQPNGVMVTTTNDGLSLHRAAVSTGSLLMTTSATAGVPRADDERSAWTY